LKVYPESALCDEPVHLGEGGLGIAPRRREDGTLDYSDGITGRLQHFYNG